MSKPVKAGLTNALSYATKWAKAWRKAERTEFTAAAELVAAGIQVQLAAGKHPEQWLAELTRLGISSRSDAKSEYNCVAKVVLGVDAPRSTVNRYAYAMNFISDLLDEGLIDHPEIRQTVIEQGGMTACAMAWRIPKKVASLKSRYDRWLTGLENSSLGYLSDPLLDIQDEALCLVRKRNGRLQVLLISDDKQTVRTKAIQIKPVEIS